MKRLMECSRKRPLFAGLLATFLGLGSAVHADAENSKYHFVKVQEQNDFYQYLGVPTINSAGHVAYYAGYNDGAGGQGIFVNYGTGTFLSVHTSNTAGAGIGSIQYAAYGPAFSDSDSIAAYCTFKEGYGGIVNAYFVNTGNGNPGGFVVDTIAQTGRNGTWNYVGIPVMNKAGQIAFYGQRINSPYPEIAGPNGGITFREDTRGEGRMSLNNLGLTLFPLTKLSTSGPGQYGLSVDNVGFVVKGGDGPGEFNSFGEWVMNDKGHIAFTAAGYGDGTANLYFTKGSGFTRVFNANAGQSLQYPLNVSLNNNDQIVFNAYPYFGGAGAYTGPDSFYDKVIAAGDTLFGQPVQSVSVSNQSINDMGQITLLAQYYNGHSVIVRADPLPAAADSTAQFKITRSGFRFDRATGNFVQTVTLTNISGKTVTGPVSLALDNLNPNNFYVVNGDGYTLTAPHGSQFKEVTAGDIAPGASVSMGLEFYNPNYASIVYTPRILTGAGYK